MGGEATGPEATSPVSLPSSATYRSLHAVTAAQQPSGCCLQGSGWEGIGGARDLPRPRHSELGPRPPRNLPRVIEAGEGTGLGQGRRLLRITCPQVPKHGANTVPILKELESLPKGAETSRQPSPHCTDGEGEVDKRSPGLKATPSSLRQISTKSLEP